MAEEKLINQIKEYLKGNNIQYYENSFVFKGLRKDVPQPDGTKRRLYTVSYMISINNNKYDSDIMYYAYFDDKSKKLLYIIGPQSYEKISD